MSYNLKVGDLVTDPIHTSIKIGVVVKVEAEYYEMGRINNMETLDRCYVYWPSIQAYSYKASSSLRKINRNQKSVECASCGCVPCDCGWGTVSPWRLTDLIK